MHNKISKSFSVVAILAMLFSFMITPATAAPMADKTVYAIGPLAVINEFSASTTGTDVEFVEIYGDPNTDYSTYTILEIEGDFAASAGTVDQVIALGTTDANGFHLVNLNANDLENGSLTLLLVSNFTGALNQDLDTVGGTSNYGDGTFDTTPWTAILDAVAVNDGGATDLAYGLPVLGVGYDGLSFAPGGASRIPDGLDTDLADDWVRNDFDLAGIPGIPGTPDVGEAYNTPGAANQAVPVVVTLDPVINEFSASTTGTDVEFVEIYGDPNTDYSAYTILEIEGDFAASAGTVDQVIALGTTDANGFHLVNLNANDLENGSLTLLLVSNFTGALNQDLDTVGGTSNYGDGTFDTTPWDAILDAIAVNDGGATDLAYGLPVLGVGYDGLSYAPGGASRIPDGLDTDLADDWVRNDFDLAGIPGIPGTPVVGEAYNTPGAANQVVLPALVINEVDYDQPSTDAAEFVEIRNNTSSAISLDGVTLELVNGSGGGAVVYDTIVLPAVSLAAGDYYVVCANAATVGNCDLDDGPDTNFIQNGAPDAIGLLWNGSLIDAVSYEGDSGAPYTEGSGVGLVDDGVSATQGISRCDDGVDSNQNNADFTLVNSTPGVANACAGVDPAPEVSSTYPVNGAADFPIDANLTVTFSEDVNVAGSWFNLSCSTSGANIAATVSGGPAVYTLDPSVNLVNGENCTLTVYAASVTDQDAIDPPDNMLSDFSIAFSPYAIYITQIHHIQGPGSAVIGPGPFTVEAIVVGDYQAQGSGQLRGFFIQEEDADVDADPATSEGIFVFCGSCLTAVNVGDKVRVTGTANEYYDMSQLTATSEGNVVVQSTGNTLPTPAAIQLPIPVPTGDLAAATYSINTYYERLEGMLVTFPATLSVSEYFELARYGQVILTQGGRPFTFTAINPPTQAGYIDHQIDLASRIVILDDTDNRQNRPIDLPNTAYFHPVPGLSTTNYFRGGDTITGLTGVLHWSYAGETGTDAWRIRPVTEAYSYNFTPVNPRPSMPAVDGRIKVASFNVLNYFLTVDTSNTCGVTLNQDCRGADSADELSRQRTKMLAALSAINADVFGFMEMENTPGVEPLADIVSGLPGYNYIDTGVIGQDAIRVGIIYKTSTVAPVGSYAILDSSVDARFDSSRNRPALAQTFEELATGERFTVVVNHLKSKGSECGAGDDDLTTGQGNCNLTRTLAAEAMLDWLTSDPTGAGDSDYLIIGDLNSYAMEDPIVALEDGGYTNLVHAFGGATAYGYVFDGQLGYLDHALASPDLLPQVAGLAEWHINADEIPLFDYNDDARTADEAAYEEESDVLPLYEPNQFRTSDHDPVIIGLDLDATAPSVTVPADMFVGATSPSGAVVTFTATATDNVDGSLTPTCNPPSGSTFPVGTTPVTCSATDRAGNTGYGYFNVTVFVPVAATFTAVPPYNGYMIELGEEANLGSAINTASGLLVAGDTLRDQQVLGFLHFNTSTLPDDAVVTRITLQVKRYNIVGTSPFTTHGNLLVDIASPFFGPEVFLRPQDFAAAPGAAAVGSYDGTLLAGNWLSTDLDPAAFPFLNPAGTTQFRLRFPLDDNDNSRMELLFLFSGNFRLAAYRPVLIVEYYLP